MDTSRELIPDVENPYVGPRPYELNDKDRFFGRNRESRDLLSLVLSERLVLFYAQSGAGKTSLINTRLKPGLEDAGFEVPLVGRVSGELPPNLKVANIFATNLMIKLDEGSDDVNRFAGLRLVEFLLNLTKEGKSFYYRPPTQPGQVKASAESTPPLDSTAGSLAEAQLLPRALVIDQFEELFNTHLEAWKQREDFLLQLAEAMEADPYLWVVLAMREDHIAELDPYAALLPNGLRVRYYMQRMSETAGFEAVTKPVEKLRPFEDNSAKLLVQNLSRISAGRDESGLPRFVEGEFIEPVQLQVVCYQLWENLKNQPGDQITLEDLQRLAHGQDLGQFVNQALADYYQDTLKKALHQPGSNVREGKLREWFSTQLITEAGTRGFVYMGESRTAGVPNEVVQFLEGKLVRSESRAAGRWYELVHDRFIDPILQANRHWAQARQRKLLIRGGGGLFAFLVISVCLFLSFGAYFIPTSLQGQATKVYQTLAGTVAVAQQDASAAATAQYLAHIAAENAKAQTTQVYAALQVVQDSKENIIATQVGEASTSTAAVVVEARLTLEAQLGTSYPTSGTATTSTPLPSPTRIGFQNTPTPSPDAGQPTPSTDPGQHTPTSTSDMLFIQQTATAAAVRVQLEDLNAIQTALADPVQDVIIGYTNEKTPIHVTQIGTGTRNIVLVGGLTGGYALSTVELAKQLQDYFQINIHQIPDEVKLHIVINANPDSLASPGTVAGRLNANRVDLNRNWDCKWVEDATFSTFPVSGGSQPFSEPETQALRDYFLRTQPVAVVIWDAAYSDVGLIVPGGCGDRSMFSNSLAALFSKETAYNLRDLISEDTGDAANWLDAQGIPAIRVRLPYREFPSRVELKSELAKNVKAIRELINYIR